MGNDVCRRVAVGAARIGAGGGGGSTGLLSANGGATNQGRRGKAGGDAAGVGRTRCCVCGCPCVRPSERSSVLRARWWVGAGGPVPDSDLQLSGSRLFPSNSAWIPHTEPKCQFTALSPAPFP